MIPTLTLLLVLAAEETPAERQLRALLARISRERLEETVRALVACHNRNTYSEDGKETGDRGIGAARRLLRKSFEAIAADSNGRLTVAEDWYDLPTPRVRREGETLPESLPTARRAANVLATLKGARDTIFIVSGHYDSRATGRFDVHAFAPGANDDASGTAVVVELARVLADQTPECTILFACYSGEEQGLHGSTHHAQTLDARLAFVGGVLNNDIVGNTTGDDGVRDDRTIRLFSHSEPGPDSPSREWARFAAERIRAFVPELRPRHVFRIDRLSRSGDHRPFDDRDVPALRFTEPREAYTRQHQDVREAGGVRYGDVIEHVDFAYLERVARANLAVLWSAAQAPDPPRRVTLARDHGTGARISWSPARAPDVVRYEAVWRDTTAADWESARDVGPKTDVTIEAGIDDLLFGVRAVDADGWKSPVTPAWFRSPVRR
jgi:hypothetical protein